VVEDGYDGEQRADAGIGMQGESEEECSLGMERYGRTIAGLVVGRYTDGEEEVKGGRGRQQREYHSPSALSRACSSAAWSGALNPMLCDVVEVASRVGAW
jgi:hypothetical protein